MKLVALNFVNISIFDKYSYSISIVISSLPRTWCSQRVLRIIRGGASLNFSTCTVAPELLINSQQRRRILRYADGAAAKFASHCTHLNKKFLITESMKNSEYDLFSK